MPGDGDNDDQQSDAAAASDGDAAPADASAHQIRFVARTLDGTEVISAPMSLKAGPGATTQAKVEMAYWGHAVYRAGQTAYACADAFGAEGAVVRFIIEKSGGGWTTVADLRAKVKDEKAVAEWPIPADTPKGTKIRFRAETAFSKKKALEFTVGGAGDEPAGPPANKPPPSEPPPANKPPPPPPPANKPPPPPPPANKPPPPPPPPPANKPPPPPPPPPPANKPPPPPPPANKPPPPPPPANKPPPPPPPANKPPPPPPPANKPPPPPPPANKPPPPPPPAKPPPPPPPAKPPPPPPPAKPPPPPPPAKPPPPPPPAQVKPLCHVFEHINFGGWKLTADKEVYYVGNQYNDKISSIEVVSGYWRFYQDWHYEGPHIDYGPGKHSYVGDAWNDRISSYKPITEAEFNAGKAPPAKPPPHHGGGHGGHGGPGGVRRR